MPTFDEVKNELAKQIADAMYMEMSEIPEEGLFSSFGLESITLVRVIEKINETFGISIEMREVLPHQTLRDSSTVIFNYVSGANS